ncbi:MULTISPECIES: pirin family protein [unclassified Ensifer]|uniref:pirin family protein n=1 Tax=unclassified Ensifer TaxID=2633371 RepID=UPI000813701B|nr:MULTISPECIES: pirin family protein [unclassified Ensifer]OCP15308.1 quercetin 2,3-dioxygenase [Ensifer sp. LC384]OCP21531.1 quercetin 2,3-dioxygenase [Ensifer sp. LC54]
MRKILGIFGNPRPHWVGDGFPVRSLLSHDSVGEHASPFLLLDYAGPTEFAPASRPRGVGVHPHRGFETVTIVYRGEVDHRDSAGNGGHIGPGDVQWMTAAGGILHEEHHSEAFTKQGGTLEMVQLWVNLPARAKSTKPGYQTLLNRDIPEVVLPEGAGTLRVIAGEFDGRDGPAKTFTPINLWDLRLSEGGSLALDLPEGNSVGLAVLHGTVLVNGSDLIGEAQFGLMSREGGAITLDASSDASVLVLSGEPIDEPVVMHGPFVMNTADEIRQAFADFQNGSFGAVSAPAL